MTFLRENFYCSVRAIPIRSAMVKRFTLQWLERVT